MRIFVATAGTVHQVTIVNPSAQSRVSRVGRHAPPCLLGHAPLQQVVLRSLIRMTSVQCLSATEEKGSMVERGL